MLNTSEPRTCIFRCSPQSCTLHNHATSIDMHDSLQLRGCMSCTRMHDLPFRCTRRTRHPFPFFSKMEGVPLIVKTWLGTHILIVWSDHAFAYVCGRSNPLIQSKGDAEGKFRSSRPHVFDVVTFMRGPRGPMAVLIYNMTHCPVSPPNVFFEQLTANYARRGLSMPRLCSLHGPAQHQSEISAFYELAPNDDSIRVLFRETSVPSMVSVPVRHVPNDFDVDMHMPPQSPIPMMIMDEDDVLCDLDGFLFCSSSQCSNRLYGMDHTCTVCLTSYCSRACMEMCDCKK